MTLDSGTVRVLSRVAAEIGTPCYAYLMDDILARFDLLDTVFGGRFKVSYAIKSNPNRALLEGIKSRVVTLDASSAGELDRALDAGYDASDVTFSGPAKRDFELQRAVEVGCGEMVCESERELEILNRLCAESGRSMSIFLRINPDKVPKKFGVNMAGRPSQFGIDEGDMDAVLSRLPEWKNLRFAGFHVYSGTNSLSADAIAENFSIFIELFIRFSEKHRLQPDKLIFGSGFGIPYFSGDEPLDTDKLGTLVNPQIDAIRSHPLIGNAEYVLEMGRFLVGPNGYFLTSIIGEKNSRGTEIRLCDGGMNNHLAACGLLGMVIRRNYPAWKVTGNSGPDSEYMLVGPLCTTIDTLAERITMPGLQLGDVVAIGSSGAYGLTSSPVGFISHPAPHEALVTGRGDDACIVDVTQ